MLVCAQNGVARRLRPLETFATVSRQVLKIPGTLSEHAVAPWLACRHWVSFWLQRVGIVPNARYCRQSQALPSVGRPARVPPRAPKVSYVFLTLAWTLLGTFPATIAVLRRHSVHKQRQRRIQSHFDSRMLELCLTQGTAVRGSDQRVRIRVWAGWRFGGC